MLIEKYTPAWVESFEAIKHEIQKALGGNLYDIEHIGSTSVPGLDSKPIIDIDIVYTRLDDFENIKYGLERIGYYHNGNQGVKDRDVFKRNGKLTNKILDTMQHHLYACPIESEALKRHILSRNYLRKNDWARLKYQQMKYELAQKANQDRKTYQALKELYTNDFIDSIVDSEKSEGTTSYWQ